MVLLLATAVVAQQSLQARIAPRITEDNGYSDYVRAADVVNDGLYDTYEEWLAFKFNRESIDDDANMPTVPPGVLLTDSYLQCERKLVERYGGCGRMLEMGNMKQVYDPRSSYATSTIFPEFQQFKRISKTEMMVAHVQFADGRSDEAVATLMDELTFARKISVGPIISHLVCIACQAIGLAEIYANLPQLSLKDAEKLDNFSAACIRDQPSASEAVRRDAELMMDAIKGLFTNPAAYANQDGSDEISGIAKSLAAMSQEDRNDIESMVMASGQQFVQSMTAELDGPEGSWQLSDPSQSEDNSQGKKQIAEAIVDAVTIRGNNVQILRAEAKIRTQMRLLNLNAKAIEYRWQHGKLADRLEDFTVPSERIDPFSKQPFIYQKKGTWFKITSAGFPGIGEIAMKYSQPQASGGTTGASDPGTGQP